MAESDESTETIFSLKGKTSKSEKCERGEEQGEDQTVDNIVSQPKSLKFKNPLVR
jgi:hypothetical protein